MPGRPWTDEDDERLRDLYASGWTLNQISKEMNRSSETISRRCKDAGLLWDQAAMKEATESLRIQTRARRTQLRSDLQQDMEKLRKQLWSPTTVFNFGGKDNTYEEQTLPEPPIVDKLRLLQAINSASTTVERLEKLDADQGIQEAIGMLDKIADAIQEAADQMELESLL